MSVLTGTLARAGYTDDAAQSRTQGLVAASADLQAALLASLDCFLILSLPAALAAALTLFIKKWRPPPAVGPSEPSH